ncbi:MAG: fibronectin type III domain-containing protein [Acidobacteria bacterium]|nr:fibronectin type III domain-containing protein [Acidobacteriota bacterium]
MLPRHALQGPGAASISTTRGATPDVHHGLRATLLVGLVVMVQLWGCGMRGPPLAPFVLVPAPVTELAVRRIGGTVYVGFTLPTRNRDGTDPADLVRVDVYAMTTQPRVRPDRRLNLEEFEAAATLVASIEVRPWETPADAIAADPAGEPPDDPRPGQGFPVVVSETLAAATLVPVDPWEDERDDEEDDDETLETPVIVPPLMTPPLPGPLQREYVVVGVSSKGREAESQRVAVPLMMPPAPPPAPGVTYTEEVIDVTWELPPGARATVQAPTTSTGGSAPGAPAAGDASAATPADAVANTTTGQTAFETPGTTPPRPILPSRPIVEWPPASRYDLYEIVESHDGPPAMPQPLNTMPLTIPAYADGRVEFGVERCYAVSTLDVVGGLDMRSGLSVQTCVTLVDTFPPAAPEGLTGVGSDGAVSLIWQPNDEDDLAGYLVLRGVPPGETLQPLTPAPVQENTYRDTTAEPGVRYVYAVRAVDTVTPPNVSPLSNQVENAAR